MTTAARLDPAVGTPATRRKPWKELGVFLGLVAGLTATTTTIAVTQDANVHEIESATPVAQAALYGQALVPLIAAVVTRLVTAGTLRRPGWGLRRTSWRSVGAAWGWALGASLASVGVLWATGLAGFRSEGLTPMVALGLTVLTLPYVVLAVGEDVGWRGLLVTRLAEVAGPRTVVGVAGLIWSAFHYPLIIALGGTPTGVPVWWALLWFTVGTSSLGAVLASMQLRWGLWPGVVAHAVVNTVGYHVVEPMVTDTGRTNWFGTETGMVSALVLLAAAALWLRFVPLRRSPDGGTTAAPRG